MKKEPIPLNIGPLYESRVLILLETLPQSNIYHQVLLSPNQFFEISKCIKGQFQQSLYNPGLVRVLLSDQFEIKVDPKIQSCYTPEEIAKK